MKAFGRDYLTKWECSVQKTVYLVISELKLRKNFLKIIFLDSDLPEKRCKKSLPI